MVGPGVVVLDDDPQLMAARVMPAHAATQANFGILTRISNVKGESNLPVRDVDDDLSPLRLLDGVRRLRRA